MRVEGNDVLLRENDAELGELTALVEMCERGLVLILSLPGPNAREKLAWALCSASEVAGED